MLDLSLDENEERESPRSPNDEERESEPPKDGLDSERFPNDEERELDPPKEGRDAPRSPNDGREFSSEREPDLSLKEGADLWLERSLNVDVGRAEFEPNEERESSRLLGASVRSTRRPLGASPAGFA